MKSEMVRIEVSIIFLSLQNVFNSSLRMGILEFKVFHQPFVGKLLKLFGSVNFSSKTIKALLILNNSYFACSRSIHLAITSIQKSSYLQLVFFCLAGIYEIHCFFPSELTVFCFLPVIKELNTAGRKRKTAK